MRLSVGTLRQVVKRDLPIAFVSPVATTDPPRSQAATCTSRHRNLLAPPGILQVGGAVR
jgi:hypothetical protein